MSAGGAALSVLINGERYDPAGPHVSSRDRGLTLADGIFETLRVRAGRIFRLDGHLTRLREGLAKLRIHADVDDVRAWALRAVADAGLDDGAMRITVTRGPGTGGLAPAADAVPTVVVTTGPVPAFPSSIYAAGLTAHVASGRRNERAMTAGLKTLAYTDAVAAIIEAQQAGADEALFLDGEGHLSEASASNLFVWTGKVLLTPPLTCGALPGITRAAVVELAVRLGVQVSDRAFGLHDLMGSREAFLTSSLRGVAPLVQVDGRSVGDGTPGPMAQRLRAAYVELVDQECSG